ncbi:putative disease resistance protein [Camellia lanceoleosa]|uniref:Disease resistance protein n=1 Tax=Camellia lanceoleosa TaxID=1840588 RepID=A0ACC0HRS5_9ERIC|nr:putative disease resistance protein [Camellia lanceoleosa]
MADALVGGAFLSATLQVLFDRLASREVISVFRGRKVGDRLLKKLNLSLLELRAVLNDAENKQITNPSVKEWAEELKDVIYHADDLVDEIATEALRSKSEADYQSSSSTSSHSRLSQVLSLIPLTSTSSGSTTASFFDAGIESRLEKIIDDLEYFAQKKDVLGLREVPGHNNWFHKSQTSSLVDVSGVYGRAIDKEDVMKVTFCPKLIGGLPKHIPSWVRVDIRGCPGLTASLPRSCVANRLVLWGCDGVELGWQGLSSLVELVISSASVKELTPELYTLINLKVLFIERCPDLLLFPDTRLPPMLTDLGISDCRAIRCLPEKVMCLNSCLKSLSVWDCPKLVFPLSEEMENCYTSLESLSLVNCDSLPSLPLELFPKLQSLRIEDCRNFETLLTPYRLGFQNFASLERLSLDGCSNMESFSQQVLIAPNLKTFDLWNCKKLKSLPDRMHSLTSLQSLSIWNCPRIESFPEGDLPSSLHSLEIRNCAKLVARRREWGLRRLPSLTRFLISGKYEEDVLESFPEEGLLPSTLKRLEIKDLPNLKSLNNRGLQHLGSLKNMKIAGCPQLQSLPEEGLPTSLFLLEILACPLLKPHCLREEGQDWHKIARIPLLHTDSELSFDRRTVGPTQPYSLLSEFDTAIF